MVGNGAALLILEYMLTVLRN